jgi:hypothetical protein
VCANKKKSVLLLWMLLAWERDVQMSQAFFDDYDRTSLCDFPFTSLVYITHELNCIYEAIYFVKF